MYGNVSTTEALRLVTDWGEGQGQGEPTSTYLWPLASLEEASLMSWCVGREDSFLGAGELLLFLGGLFGGLTFGF